MAEDRIGRASVFLASGTIVSRILGFVKTALLAAVIGASGAGANAFAAANQLPNTICVVVAGGVLSAVLVPLIVRSAAHADGGTAYINKLITLGLVILGGAAAIATLLTPLLTLLIGSRMEPEVFWLAVAFGYWCLPQIFFYGMYSLLGEVLNAKRVFGPFTWVPVLNNLVALAGLGVFALVFGADPTGKAWEAGDWSPAMIALLAGSATLGVAAQALILFVFWRRAGLRYRPDFRWRGVGLRSTAGLAGWTFGMLLLSTIAGFVETSVVGVSANSTDEASIMVQQTAWLIFMLPHSVITVSIATAYFTRMSEHAAVGALDRVRADLSSAVRGITMIVLVAAAVLMVCAYPFARVFTPVEPLIWSMGHVIMAYVIGLVGFSVLFIVQRTFYSMHDTKTPFFFTLVQASVFIAGALACIALPSSEVVFGIALVTTIAGTVQLIVALVLLRRRLGALDGRRITRALVRALAALVVPVAAGIGLLIALGGTDADGFALSGIFAAIVSMAVIGAVMAVLYFAGLWLLRSPELRGFAEPLVRRLRRE
ncbi:murein biosynthesis integral membrane protein MurJ [Agromyces aerolatus]|uniref:murein biosynthesis integral membrane protein MurJ n=1 Tax=Agromyces sp. LY-1074 TaxID=3074080 RepID=UPI0028631B43|nr:MULTISPECIES: lipid II flippase MurJ [unclassified Agromyces]MDR5699316.1 lipid II flippase MurJ [Agromyces sp. LY-1074]MDR5705612.1 lipid II flippase MurJ [Agromyces sp. LY-1358]